MRIQTYGGITIRYRRDPVPYSEYIAAGNSG